MSEKTAEMAIFRIDAKSGDFCKQSYIICVDGKNGGFMKLYDVTSVPVTRK